MKNFKDWNSIAQWQEDLYKQWVPYEESKQYAIDNKLTFWDWQSVKTYTWWKTTEKSNWYHFKDWNDFRTKLDAIYDQIETEEDKRQLQEVLNSSDIWWISFLDLWWNEITDMKANQLNRLIKEKSTNEWFDELMWYYDDEDNSQNEDIYNEILYSPDLSSKQKEEKLKELKWKVKDTRMSNLDEADDTTESIQKAIDKNKKSEKLANKLQEWESWILWQKEVRSNNWLSVTTTKNLTKNWISEADYNNYLKQLQNIASSWDSNRKKYFKTQKLKKERNNKLNNLRLYYNNQYWNKALSANKWKELTSEQQAEKKMLEKYLSRWTMLNEKANAYTDSYWTYYIEPLF